MGGKGKAIPIRAEKDRTSSGRVAVQREDLRLPVPEGIGAGLGEGSEDFAECPCKTPARGFRRTAQAAAPRRVGQEDLLRLGRWEIRRRHRLLVFGLRGNPECGKAKARSQGFQDIDREVGRAKDRERASHSRETFSVGGRLGEGEDSGKIGNCVHVHRGRPSFHAFCIAEIAYTLTHRRGRNVPRFAGGKRPFSAGQERNPYRPTAVALCPFFRPMWCKSPGGLGMVLLKLTRRTSGHRPHAAL